MAGRVRECKLAHAVHHQTLSLSCRVRACVRYPRLHIAHLAGRISLCALSACVRRRIEAAKLHRLAYVAAARWLKTELSIRRRLRAPGMLILKPIGIITLHLARHIRL